ncbi:MAG: methanol---5-hydroxybenzimidazolylcobamide Co-methyltransferase [Clostridiales bacterium]|jgi:methanol--5-hydroxybenzimidazolylcobamide Co-methyltransferase|nr:methanol---5-hydroxybenzimidazolylcobamide Co-methyltransferase [Clostridiales bacterium]MDK2933863.1 methanol---5-hydroxybenzimidazolylcobamide Co-methyltransferase [Clostridiales bacterium]
MAKKMFSELVYKNTDELIYGSSKNPVTCKNGMIIGGGQIFPEVNFTLPPMSITKETMPEILVQYKNIIEDICKRAKELYVPGFVAEIELLPPMTFHPEWGIEITKIVRDVMYEYEAKYGLKSALRITPNDIREGKELTHMWHGYHWDNMLKTFRGCAEVGADFLSIESIGGKEVHDDATMFCDITKSLFALSILGAKDMAKLWEQIVNIADNAGSIPAGDTACGFANTAMVLADRGYIPKVFSAVVRVMSVVRSLTAFEQGAIGPHKDCGYEGVYVKTITGCPISMEGKSSACAHSSPVGNIAAAMADLWSNESVQNIKLLGGMAPTVSLEQLAYDCRLMNTATEKSKEYAIIIRDLLSDSDSKLDPQAYILRPDVVFNISKEIITENSPFKRTKKAAYAAIDELRKAVDDKKLLIEEKDSLWLDTIESQLELVSDDEEAFTKQMLEEIQLDTFDSKKYDM